MFPKRGGACDGCISKLGEMQLEDFIHNAPGLFQAWHFFVDFHINPAVGGQGSKIVLADDFVGDNIQGNLHVFIPGHICFIKKKLCVQDQEPGIGGGNGSIQKTFGCREDGAVCGGNSWKSSLSPPTVTRTRWVSVFCGQILENRQEYVTLRPANTSHFWMKNTVLVPVGMRVPTPCVRRPRLLSRLYDQTSALRQRMRWRYSRYWPVTSSITAWASNWRLDSAARK